jgi:hypothetical protein
VKGLFEAGEHPTVDLFFPNAEKRLMPYTSKIRAINIHLLFSPEDPDHERTIERILSRLEFMTAGWGVPLCGCQ